MRRFRSDAVSCMMDAMSTMLEPRQVLVAGSPAKPAATRSPAPVPRRRPLLFLGHGPPLRPAACRPPRGRLLLHGRSGGALERRDREEVGALEADDTQQVGEG